MDFLALWLDGQVASRGLNFYEPANYWSIPLPIPSGPGFAIEVLDVGFKYPPPTILLLMPLGRLDIHTASFVWFAAHAAVFSLCVVLLWKTFLSNYGLTGLVFSAALLVVVAGTFSTFQHGQTNFLALLMLLLFWRDRNKLQGGIWLALGVLIKPFLLLLIISPILRRNWRVLFGALITLVFASILTINLVGFEPFSSYISDNPAGRVGNFYYFESVNQSLLAVILRLSNLRIEGGSVLTNPVYLGIAVALTMITTWLVHSVREEDAGWGLSLVLMLALLIYPASQMFYSVVLVVPIVFIWVNRMKIPNGVWASGVISTAVFFLITITGYVFVANALLWTVLASISIWLLVKKGRGIAFLEGNLDRQNAIEQTSG